MQNGGAGVLKGVLFEIFEHAEKSLARDGPRSPYWARSTSQDAGAGRDLSNSSGDLNTTKNIVRLFHWGK
jgi:hypothetical protein